MNVTEVQSCFAKYAKAIKEGTPASKTEVIRVLLAGGVDSATRGQILEVLDEADVAMAMELLNEDNEAAQPATTPKVAAVAKPAAKVIRIGRAVAKPVVAKRTAVAKPAVKKAAVKKAAKPRKEREVVLAANVDDSGLPDGFVHIPYDDRNTGESVAWAIKIGRSNKYITLPILQKILENGNELAEWLSANGLWNE